MRHTLILALVIPLVATSAARAEESDEALAKRLSGVVRDFRQPLAVRVEAVRTIGKLGARASVVVPDLVTVLDRLRGSEQAPLQETIIESLGQIGSAARAALPSLAKATARTADIDLAIRQATELILLASDSENIDILTQQLVSRDPSTRLRAAKALGDLGPGAKNAVPALMTILGDPDGDVRRATIGALRAIQPTDKPPEEVIRAIARDLRDPDPNIRLVAVRTLGRIGPSAAIVAPQLDPLRGDPDPDVRRAATEAYGRLVPSP